MAYKIDPRIRALGKARLDVTRRAQDEQEWQRLWRPPRYPLPFVFNGWKVNFQYTVDDFAAEVGFFIDVLGFPVSAFSSNYAQLTTPDQDFAFSISAATQGIPATPPESIRLQFFVDGIEAILEVFDQRNVAYERLSGLETDTPQLLACLYSPNGVRLDIWALGEATQIEDEVSIQHETMAITSRDRIDDFFQDEEEVVFDAALEQEVQPPGDYPDSPDDREDDELQEETDMIEITYEDIEEEPAERLEPVYEDLPATKAPISPITADPGQLAGLASINPAVHPGPSLPAQAWQRRSKPVQNANHLAVSTPGELRSVRRSNGSIQFPTAGDEHSD